MLPVRLTELPVVYSLHWLESFALHLQRTPSQKRRARSRLSLSAYVGDVRTMKSWFEGRYGVEFEPGQLNSVNLKEYFDTLARSAKPATYNRKLASVRLLIQWGMDVGVLEEDPSAWIPFVDAVRDSPRDVNEEERLRLEEAAEAGEVESLIGLRDSLMFFLMSNAGLRISEVVGLGVADVDLEQGTIMVRNGKGGKHRKPRIGGRLAGKLRLWLERMPVSREGNLITDESGFGIGREQAWRRFASIAGRAGVKVTPHGMRHTFVLRYMDAVMSGDPSRLPMAIDAVCQMTGDRPEVILAYYTRARESDLRAAAELM